MIRELERDLSTNNLKEWTIMDFSTGASITGAGFGYGLLLFQNIESQAIGGALWAVLPLIALGIVLHMARKQKTFWRTRVGEDVTVEYMEACADEERARRVIEHKSVLGSIGQIESAIKYISEIDKRAIEWHEPIVPKFGVASILFFATGFFGKAMERLGQLGRPLDVLSSYLIGLAASILVVVFFMQTRGLFIGRRTRRRRLYRDLVEARAFLEIGKRPAPWLDFPSPKIVPIVNVSHTASVKPRKGRRARR
ncbi:hypothetical protein [Corallococcus exercitus]|uniref:hypothetical protein n=1 Tax=Corallococcus exercitus TaxID=2316736 RepID=UPI0011C3D544|nr:hypothetical protein [Corallococcus exercitus]